MPWSQAAALCQSVLLAWGPGSRAATASKGQRRQGKLFWVVSACQRGPRVSAWHPSLPLPFTCPSVEAEKHSVPVLDCSQMAPYTGSLWLTSTVDTSTGSPPFLVSQ